MLGLNGFMDQTSLLSFIWIEYKFDIKSDIADLLAHYFDSIYFKGPF